MNNDAKVIFPASITDNASSDNRRFLKRTEYLALYEIVPGADGLPPLPAPGKPWKEHLCPAASRRAGGIAWGEKI